MAEENTAPTFSTKEDLFTAITALQTAVADLQVQIKEQNQAQTSDEPDPLLKEQSHEPDLKEQADEVDSWLGA